GPQGGSGGGRFPVTEEEAFVRAVREVPEEDGPRLVYADWLDEHGRHERAEFIRAHCLLTGLDDGDEGRAALVARLHRLHAAHGQAWFDKGGLGKPGSCSWRWGRGLVEGLTTWRLRALPGLFARHPIRDLRLELDQRTGQWARALGRPGILDQLDTLRLHPSL